MQTGQLPGVFLSIIDFKFFAHFNICPPIIKSSSIFTIPNNVLSSIFQFWLYSDCIEHLFDCQCDSFIFWLGIFNYKLSWSQNMTMNTLFSKLYIFKQYQCLPEYLSHMHLHSNLVIFKYRRAFRNNYIYHLYIPIWLYSNEWAGNTWRCWKDTLHSNLVIFKSESYNTIYSRHFKPHFLSTRIFTSTELLWRVYFITIKYPFTFIL